MWPVVAWGNRDLLGGAPLRGGGVPGVLLPLAARRHPRPRRARTPPLPRGDRPDQPPGFPGRMTMWPRRNRADKPGSAATPPTGAAVPPLVREPGWEALPPLGPTAPTVQLAIATDRFEAELPSRQSTRFLG